MDIKRKLKENILRNPLLLLDREAKIKNYLFPTLWLIIKREIIKFLRVKIPHIFERPEFVKATTFFGLPMKILRHDKFCMDTWGVMGGGTDLLAVKFLVDNVKEGMTVIDGGAYIGWYSALTSELVGKTGSVHSFEPTPSTFLILKENLMGKNNIFLNNTALSNRSGSVEFCNFGDQFGYSNVISPEKNFEIAIHNSPPSKFKRIINVTAVRLDDYCAEKKIKPDFLKLDLEGGEYLALLGAEETLRKYKPTIIVEIAKSAIESDGYDKIINFLRPYGYSAYWLSTDENFNLYLRPFQVETAQNFNLENIIFSVFPLS